MQYLKDEVKKSITEAALKEFRERGYIEASMRTIAKNAGITVGNIYRYFSSKDDLFNDIMDRVWQDVTRAIFDNYNLAVDLFPITEITAAIMTIYRKYNIELYILLHGSKGSKYENIKNGLIELITRRVENEMVPLMEAEGKTVRDPFIFQIIANAIVEGIYLIIKEVGDNFERVESLMGQTITVFVKDLYKRL